MIRRRSRFLLMAAAAAVVVELVGAFGWWSWQTVKRQLEDDPELGAVSLAQNLGMKLPSAIRASRRLPGRQLGLAPDDLVVSALLALSEGQRRWIPADPSGYVNRARAKLIEGSIDDAWEDLNAAIIRNPTSPRLHRLAALTERARGQTESALDHLATAEGLAPGGRADPGRIDARRSGVGSD